MKKIFYLLLIFIINSGFGPKVIRFSTNSNWKELLPNGTSTPVVLGYPAAFQITNITNFAGTNYGAQNMIWSNNPNKSSVTMYDSVLINYTCNMCVDSARFWINADDTAGFYLNNQYFAGCPNWWTFTTGKINTALLAPGWNRLEVRARDLYGGPRYAFFKLEIYYHFCED